MYSTFQPFLFSCKVNTKEHKREKRGGVGEEVKAQNGKMGLATCGDVWQGLFNFMQAGIRFPGFKSQLRSLTNCVILGKLLSPSEPPFPHV